MGDGTAKTHGVLRSGMHRARLRLRQQYYERVAPHRGASRRTGPPTTLDAWVDQLGAPGRIVVVAAGPTALALQPQPGDLHVATNSSESVVADLDYVSFLAEHSMVVRAMKRGPAAPSCRGAFFRVESYTRDPRQEDLGRRATHYARTYTRPVPEVIACDLEEGSVEARNFDQFGDAIEGFLGQGVRQYNSGFGAVYLGFYLAAALGVPLHIYGMDAGVGGERHFDGTQMSSPSVVGDRVREQLAALYLLIQQQEHVTVANHSAFMPW